MAITDYAIVDEIKTLATTWTTRLHASLESWGRRFGLKRELPAPTEPIKTTPARVYHPHDFEEEYEELGDIFSWCAESSLSETSVDKASKTNAPESKSRIRAVRGVSDSSPLIRELTRQKLRSDSVLAAKGRGK